MGKKWNITNGFWGYDTDKAKAFIERTKEKLIMISFSYDEFHKEFISLKNILNIIKIANDLEVKTEIVGCFLTTGLQPSDILAELKEYAYLTEFKYQPVISTGAANCFSDSELIKLFDLEKHNARCVSIFQRQILVNPNLDVYPCCSQVIENTILLFGNLKESTLNNIIESIKHNKVLHTVFIEGFAPFIDLMKNRAIDYPKKLSMPCELCAFLFSDNWFLDELNAAGYYENI